MFYIIYINLSLLIFLASEMYLAGGLNPPPLPLRPPWGSGPWGSTYGPEWDPHGVRGRFPGYYPVCFCGN